MSKKDFIAIAAIFAKRREIARRGAERIVVDHLARDMADLFGSRNERFDRARFLEACGGVPER